MPSSASKPIEATRLLETTGHWLFERLSFFSIREFYSSRRLVDLIKPMGELVLASSLIRRYSNNPFKELAYSFTSDAWDQLLKGELLREAISLRPDLLVLSGVYATFKEAGFCNEKLEREITKIAATPGFFMQDWPAWRRLDLLLGLKGMGIDVDNEISSTFKSTWLSGCYPAWTLTEGSAYGVTHSIFYMTDYGANPDGCSPHVTQYLRNALPTWVKYYLNEPNFDLASEMLMSMCCIGEKTAIHGDFAYILQNQLPDGAIPGPDFGSATLLHGESDESRRYFLHHYHTTLVTFMASSMFCDNQ